MIALAMWLASPELNGFIMLILLAFLSVATLVVIVLIFVGMSSLVVTLRQHEPYPYLPFYDEIVELLMRYFPEHPEVYRVVNELSEKHDISVEEAESNLEHNRHWPIDTMLMLYMRFNLFMLWHVVKVKKFPLRLTDVLWVLLFPSVAVGITAIHILALFMVFVINAVKGRNTIILNKNYKSGDSNPATNYAIMKQPEHIKLFKE